MNKKIIITLVLASLVLAGCSILPFKKAPAGGQAPFEPAPLAGD